MVSRHVVLASARSRVTSRAAYAPECRWLRPAGRSRPSEGLPSPHPTPGSSRSPAARQSQHSCNRGLALAPPRQRPRRSPAGVRHPAQPRRPPVPFPLAWASCQRHLPPPRRQQPARAAACLGGRPQQVALRPRSLASPLSRLAALACRQPRNLRRLGPRSPQRSALHPPPRHQRLAPPLQETAPCSHLAGRMCTPRAASSGARCLMTRLPSRRATDCASPTLFANGGREREHESELQVAQRRDSANRKHDTGSTQEA